MNAPPLPTSPGGLGPLHARRCVRHPAREAAARCPSCGEFFCRECVIEHDGRLLCATCLQRITATEQRRRQRWRALRRGAETVVATAALWLIFYWLGATLVSIPPEYHDGTIWTKLTRGVRG